MTALSKLLRTFAFGLLVAHLSLVWAQSEVLPQVIHDEYSEAKPKLVLSTLTAKDADDLFKEFKAQDQLGFDYLPGCCYARATAMTQMADKKSLNMGKVFIEGQLGVRNGEGKYFPVEFNWHVAPVAWVKTEKGVELMAFDPAFFDRAVPIDEFKRHFEDKIIGRPDSKVRDLYFGSKFQNKTKSEEKKKYQYSDEDLKSNATDLEKCFGVARGTWVEPRSTARSRAVSR